MARTTYENTTREEIVAALKQFAAERGESVRILDFCKHLGMARSTLLQRWGFWKDLRRAAGLKRPKAAPPVAFSEEFLLGEYRRICRELGRPPNQAEFDQRSKCSMDTLKKRFGSMARVRRRAQVAD